MARKNLLSRHRVASSLRNRRRFIGRGRNLEGRAAFKNNNRRLMSGHPIFSRKGYKWSLTGGGKQQKILKLPAEKQVAVAYMSWSVYERFQNKALTDNIFGVLGRWSLTGGGRLRDVVARGGSTVSSEFRPLLEELPVVPLQ